jgi:TonB family protein
MIRWRDAVPLLIFLVCLRGFGQKEQSGTNFPSEVIIGRHTFIDVGPPNDFYEVYVLRASGHGTSVERLTITPAGQACIQPPTVERTSTDLNQSLPGLLRGNNPCLIPEKELTQERKRCKNCIVFSGAEVNMQVQCGQSTRTLRMDILDRDMFDPDPHTPPNTSQTMALLNKLDGVLGGGVLQRPMFSLSTIPSTKARSEALEELSDGRFDSLFKGDPDKPSALYAEAQAPHPAPTISILSISPIAPLASIFPPYPPIARLARIEGKVNFKLLVTTSGNSSDVEIVDGPKMLEAFTRDAISKWTFPPAAAGKTIDGTLSFELHCPVAHP